MTHPSQEYHEFLHFDVVSLAELADKCITQLEALKTFASSSRHGQSRGLTKYVLEQQVITSIGKSILSLKDWRTNILNAQHKPDDKMVEIINDRFEQLESHIKDADDALKRKLYFRVLCWSIAHQSYQYIPW